MDFRWLSDPLLYINIVVHIVHLVRILVLRHVPFTWGLRNVREEIFVVEKSLNSLFRDHSLKCSKQISNSEFSIIGHEQPGNSLEILESLHIHQQKPNLNINQTSFPLKIVVWTLTRHAGPASHSYKVLSRFRCRIMPSLLPHCRVNLHPDIVTVSPLQ